MAEQSAAGGSPEAADPLWPEPTISSQRVFEGKILKVRVDTIALPDGRTSTREILEHPGAVVLVPVDETDHVLLVRQYRKAAERVLLELPAGTLNPGEDPAACARRELREETGFDARKIEPLGGFYAAPGYDQEYLHLFLATELHDSPLAADFDEVLQLVRATWPETLSLIESGEICDAKSVAGLLRVWFLRQAR